MQFGGMSFCARPHRLESVEIREIPISTSHDENCLLVMNFYTSFLIHAMNISTPTPITIKAKLALSILTQLYSARRVILRLITLIETKS